MAPLERREHHEGIETPQLWIDVRQGKVVVEKVNIPDTVAGYVVAGYGIK